MVAPVIGEKRMPIVSYFMLKIASGFFGCSCLATLIFPRRGWFAFLLLLPALAANTAAVVLRYRLAWPMLPMYLAPAAVISTPPAVWPWCWF